MSAPRWYVVIDPHGAANVVSDLAPGPMAVLPLLKPAGPHARGDWREVDARSRALAWDAAVAAMNAHNGGCVSPYAPTAPAEPVTARTGHKTVSEDGATAGGDSTAAATTTPAAAAVPDAVALARHTLFGMTTTARNRLLATVGERWCPRCQAALPLTAFSRHATRGYQEACRTCRNGRAAAAYRARVAPALTGLTRGSAEELRATGASEKPKPLPAAAVDREPSAPTTSSSAPVTRRPPECSPSPALSPTMQTRLTCGCTVTYNCEVAETLRARCTLAQRTVRDERAAGGVSPAAQEASAAAIQAYHVHRGPFVPGGKA